MSKTRSILYIFLFLALILLLWTGLSLLPGPAEVQLPDSYGGYDLTGYDFENTVYITAPCWESWPERLYAPEDLDSAEAPVPHQSLDYTKIQYATHRLFLTLPPGVTYGISLRSSDYAMRLYIDGREIDSVGVPGATREETVPRVRDAVYYFTLQSETAELVVNASNFVHKEGGWSPVLTIGTSENIAQKERIANLKSGLIFGCLMTACLYHLAIFLMNRRQLSALIFSVICLLLSLISGELIILMFPEYNWFAAIRIEYAVHFLTFAALAALVKMLFPGTLHKWIFRCYLAFCGLFLAITLFTDPTFFTRMLFYFDAVSIAVTAYVLVRLAMTLREKNPKNFLAFLGVALVGLFGVNDILFRNSIELFGPVAGQAFTVTIGMVFFVFCYALALSIERAEINRKLEDARNAVAEAEARCLALSEEKNGQRKPSELFSAFGLTKRETDVALLLIDGKSRAGISELLFISLGTVNSHCTRIYQKTGCRNAAELARLILPGGTPGDKIEENH